MQLVWRECTFDELSGRQVYEILRLRSEVFVVEQACAYQDLDGKDVEARHLMGSSSGVLMAYARLFAPGTYYEQAAIGRVVTARVCRRQGAGRQLMRAAIARIEQSWGAQPIRIGAQLYLKAFYESFGFARNGADYVEDGIPHLQMLRPADRANR